MLNILLSTHNGRRFLMEQLDSLSSQSFPDWTLFVRDDGSTDDTQDVLRAYRSARPGQMQVFEGAREGAARSFAELLSHANAPYVMFCDQDDVWMEDKIERSLAAMQEMEKEHGPETPLLVHTDLCVVDADLKPLAASFTSKMRLQPEHVPLKRLLVQNVPTGCTMLLNRALVSRIGHIPPQARMHDMWVALVAALFGRIHYLPAATVYYRQHADNRIGAKRGLPGGQKLAALLQANLAQAQALLERYKDAMEDTQRIKIERFVHAGLHHPLPGLQWFQEGYRREPWYQNIPLLFTPNLQARPPCTR
jgi:glycosyltransferase involved in cell wall biosynthesis